MKTGDIVRCVSPGVWERNVSDPDDKYLVLQTGKDKIEGWYFVKVLHLKSGTKSRQRTIDRYRKV